jgi:hypothetical protein
MQTTEPEIHIKFPEKNSRVQIDGFGNIYIITENEIVKYNALGIVQKKFSTKRYGRIDFVDAINPLKILVYFRDFQQILFLDNQLTQSSDVISFEKLGYEQASLVCMSSNNGFWIYEKQNNELCRFDSELKPIVKTGNLKRLLDFNIKPDFMVEHNNFLYMNCPAEGILIFDIYGTFYKTIPLRNLKEFMLVNGDVFYFENHALKQYQSQSLNIIEKPFSDTLIKTVYWKNDRFYAKYQDSLVIQ